MNKQSQPQLSPTSISTPQQTSNPIFITAYGPKQRALLRFPSTEGRTKQSHRDECDVNRIMARYMQTGVIDFVNKHEPQYGDVTAASYQTAMDQIALAQSMFHDLPSQIRNRFKNDPAEFLEFVQNPANQAEAHDLGLLSPDYKPAQPDAPAAPVVNPQPTSEASKSDK